MLYVVLAALALCIIALLAALKIVPQTDNFLIERLGKYNRSLAAGVHIIIPFIDRVAHTESILERQLPAKNVPAFTKDNVQIEITLAILYRVTDAAKAWYRIKNIDQAIETIIIGVVRSTIGASDLDQVQSNRSQLSPPSQATSSTSLTNGASTSRVSRSWTSRWTKRREPLCSGS